MAGPKQNGTAGPPKLSQERIAAAALEIIDESGVAALTMRELGRCLGVDPMAVYHHYKDRQAVLDAAANHLLGTLEATPSSRTPKETLRLLALRLRDVLMAHPNAVPLLPGLPVPTSASALQAVASEFVALSQMGVPPDKLMAAHRVLIGFVMNSAKADIEQDARRSSAAATANAAAEPDVRHGATVLLESGPQLIAGTDADRLFDLGLSACLAGIEAALTG